MVKAIILMADYGHDPTETAVPYAAFKAAGFDVTFATEDGKTPECDGKMLRGTTRLLLGATATAVKQYDTMSTSPEWLTPLSWSTPTFTLHPYDLVFLPGGHEKSVRQIIDSKRVHALLVDYFPQTVKPEAGGGGAKVVGAVCHGVMVLSEAKDEAGRCPIWECVTTALPARFEQVAFWGTRLFLGDYYKTYGVGSDDVEHAVRQQLSHPSQFKTSLSPAPFVVEDEKYNYISARFPGDVDLLAEKLVRLVQEQQKA